LARFYHRARWQRLRRLQLTQHPLRKFCLGIVMPATVADHIEPHRGNWKVRHREAAKPVRAVPQINEASD
jgi:hypothetical protein